MEKQEEYGEQSVPRPPGPTRRRDFNWSLLLGCIAIAIGIHSAGIRVSYRIPQFLHGNFNMSGHFPSMHSQEPSEFMNEWEAASFLSMIHNEFMQLVDAGELAGTYAIFQVDRIEWMGWSVPSVRVEAHGQNVWQVDSPVAVAPIQQEYELIPTSHRVFSRERLAEWLENRILT